MSSRRGFLFSCLLAASVAGIAIAQTQPPRDAGSKIRGEYGTRWGAGKSASRKMYSARSYSQGIQEYATRVPKVESVVTQSDSELIAQTLESARKDIAVMRKESAKDKDALARLELVDKHLVAALEQQKKLHEQCCKPDADKGATMECCSDLVKEIDKAVAEHDALLKKLFPEKAAPDKKKAGSK